MYNNSFIFVAYRDSSPGGKGISIIDFKTNLSSSLSGRGCEKMTYIFHSPLTVRHVPFCFQRYAVS